MQPPKRIKQEKLVKVLDGASIVDDHGNKNNPHGSNDQKSSVGKGKPNNEDSGPESIDDPETLSDINDDDVKGDVSKSSRSKNIDSDDDDDDDKVLIAFDDEGPNTVIDDTGKNKKGKSDKSNKGQSTNEPAQG